MSFSNFRLRMMIIRIGDERRSLIEDHLRKLSDMFCSDDTLKHHR